MRNRAPLPIAAAPPDSLPISPGADLFEGDEGVCLPLGLGDGHVVGGRRHHHQAAGRRAVGGELLGLAALGGGGLPRGRDDAVGVSSMGFEMVE